MGIKESNILIQNYTDCAVSEAVKHFLSKNGKKEVLNEPRYLYNEAQRRSFLRKYTNEGGNLDDIEVIKINDDFNDFLCYGIFRTNLIM